MKPGERKKTISFDDWIIRPVMRKRIFAIIVFICMIMLVLNITSIVWAVYNNQEISITDFISIVVTIILGISTLLQSEQENRNSCQSLELDIKSHTPYFVINSMIEDIKNVEGYDIIKGQRVDTSLFDSYLFKEKKIFALVGYKERGRIILDLVLKNGSNSLMSEVKVQLFDEINKHWVDNTFINPISNMIETVVKKETPDTYNDLKRQHYDELFCDEYSNILSGENFVIHLALTSNNLLYSVEDVMKKGYVPETIFLKIKILSLSIYGEKYEQTMELGMRLFAGMKEKKGNEYGYSVYDSWYVYEILKMKTKVICSI